jgi:hypothetical protein
MEFTNAHEYDWSKRFSFGFRDLQYDKLLTRASSSQTSHTFFSKGIQEQTWNDSND